MKTRLRWKLHLTRIWQLGRKMKCSEMVLTWGSPKTVSLLCLLHISWIRMCVSQKIKDHRMECLEKEQRPLQPGGGGPCRPVNESLFHLLVSWLECRLFQKATDCRMCKSIETNAESSISEDVQAWKTWTENWAPQQSYRTKTVQSCIRPKV